MEPFRIIHFVTGGGSGATRVALDLAAYQHAGDVFRPLLVLRRKKQPLPAAMQRLIAERGLRVAWVRGGWKAQTRADLAALIGEFQPHAFVAHGNSEHLWGRETAAAARLPAIVHVEQNAEKYRFWRLWRARKLAARTHATVCVSAGVRAHVQALRIGAARCEIIHNGVPLETFATGAPPWTARAPDLVMAARFARQKDHATLLRALPLLRASGWSGKALLAGGGKPGHRRAAERLVAQLQLGDRVEFLGPVADIAAVYHRCRVAVLATHHEGLPLTLAEAMSAGCHVVGTDAVGVRDIIRAGHDGWLVPPGDPTALAAALREALAGNETFRQNAAQKAAAEFSLTTMGRRYEALLLELLAPGQPSPQVG